MHNQHIRKGFSMSNKKTETKTKHPPANCRKIKCNLMNNNSSIILYDKEFYIYNLPIALCMLFMWLFGATGLLLGLWTGYLILAIIFCFVLAFLGYVFCRTYINGKQIYRFSIDQVRKITCDREIVRIYLKEHHHMIELKMAPHHQAMLLSQVGNSLRIDFGLDPQIEPNLLWFK